MQDFWETSFSLRFGDIDRSDRLTLSATFNYFQEVAINHAESIGIGRDAMAKSGQVWILSRMSVVLYRRPTYRENITVRTFPIGWEKLFALREYDIRDSSNEAIVRGSSSWIILDIEKRRPIRPQTIMEKIALNKSLATLPGGAIGIPAQENLQKIGERKALFSDIDYNGHVNNARYINWIEDIVEPELIENAVQMRLDINYLGEVKFGEITELWSSLRGTSQQKETESISYVFEGRKEGQAVFRAELTTVFHETFDKTNTTI